MSVNTVEVSVDPHFYPSFTIDGVEYHITLAISEDNSTSHISATNLRKHYGYQTEQKLIEGRWKTVLTDKSFTPEEKSKNSKESHLLFSNLPIQVQDFIAQYYDEIMKIKSGNSKTFNI